MELTVDKKKVFAATGGKEFDPKLPAIIFIHGSGMDHTVWQLQTRYFAWHGRGVLAVDMPGHGRSEGPPLTTIADMAAWVGKLMDAAGLEKAALVGHSMGCFIALEATRQMPERVSAIGLCAVAEKMPVHPELLEAAKKGDHHAVDLVVSWGFDTRAHLGGYKAPGVWMTGAGMRLLERDKVAALGADLQASNDYQDALEAAKAAKVPILYVLGAHDKMTPARKAQPLIDASADPHVSTIPDCGHMMMSEAPDETLDALKKVM